MLPRFAQFALPQNLSFFALPLKNFFGLALWENSFLVLKGRALPGMAKGFASFIIDRNFNPLLRFPIQAPCLNSV